MSQIIIVCMYGSLSVMFYRFHQKRCFFYEISLNGDN